MITNIYFVRHAQSDNSVKDEYTRPLTQKGLADRFLARDFLIDKEIDIIYSSPYVRAVDTVMPLAEALSLEVITRDSFRERESGDTANIPDFRERQWSDKNFHAPDGESFLDVQKRYIDELHCIVQNDRGKNIVIGCHGMALSTLFSYFDEAFGYNEFLGVTSLMPCVVKVTFCDGHFSTIESKNLFDIL